MTRPVPTLERSLAVWVAARSGSPLLGRAAARVQRAESAGHACAALAESADGEPAFDAEERAAVLGHPWVGDADADTPFVRLPGDRLAFRRNAAHEARLAAALRARAARRDAPADSASEADLDALFAGVDPVASADQRAAVARAPGARLLVLTGGPGTGKTTTLLRLLLLALRHRPAARDAVDGAAAAVLLAAPTGKAAQRLAQAVRDGLAELAPRLSADWSPVIDALRGREGLTLHRLLGARPDRDAFAHGPDAPLPADVVVVDEASMADLATMRGLLEALAPETLLVLAGDADQLASVAAGSVLADLVHAAESGGPLRDAVAHLSHVWRASGGMAEAYADARRGDGAALRARPAVRLRAVTEARSLSAALDAWIETADWPGLARERDPARALARLRRCQLLCALREGPWGAEGANRALEARLRDRLRVPVEAPWFAGCPVIVRRNDPARGLSNGDVGLVLDAGDGLRAWFDGADASGRPQPHAVPLAALPEHGGAFALTVHKSQGSEYDTVALLLPPEPDHPLLARGLVYTAITRARHAVELWATAAVVDAALARPTRRLGGLRERLQAE